MLNNIRIDKSWTLFLDRDGVINEKRVYDYVKTWDEFVFNKGAVEAISELSNLFGRIIVVTNQRCIGRGIISEQDLSVIHENMCNEITRNRGRIDKILHCPEVSDSADCRKPNLGMAFKAKSFFPEIDFHKSVIVGDSNSDMIFGKRAGMVRVYISEGVTDLKRFEDFDLMVPSLISFGHYCTESKIL